jgi:hypothetical protein
MDSNNFRNRAVTKRRRDITIWRIVTDEDSHQLQTKDRQMTEATTTNAVKRSVFIEAREWFDKVNGNSYFSARIWVDGEIVSVLPMQYGYESHYKTVAHQELIALGYFTETQLISIVQLGKNEGVDIYTSKTNTNKSEMFK